MPYNNQQYTFGTLLIRNITMKYLQYISYHHMLDCSSQHFNRSYLKKCEFDKNKRYYDTYLLLVGTWSPHNYPTFK